MNASRSIYNLEIEGMTGNACIQKVTTALKGVKGVEVDSVEKGNATIRCDSPELQKQACGAIKSAGFKATGSATRSSATPIGGKAQTADATPGDTARAGGTGGPPHIKPEPAPATQHRK